METADLTGAIHAYATYSTADQRMPADIAVDDMLFASGKLILGFSKFVR